MLTLLLSVLNTKAEMLQEYTHPAIKNFMTQYGQLFMLLIFVLIFYFLLIRPQNKQRHTLNDMINNLKIGDKIITKGGIIAKISVIKENSLIIEVENNTKIEILKHAVVSLINDDQK